MKKYLMIGFAALAFASCANHDFETTTQADIDKAKYDQAFMSYIGGRPAANQDWGFGAFVGTRAFTRGHNANANEWGATYSNVPSVLTSRQKLRVQKYFQYNNQPEGISVNYKDFFVQDVYKGNSDPLNDGETSSLSQYSTEQYLFGGQMEPGSEHMDKLTAGSDNDHINNYNNATCTINNNVWNGALIPQTEYADGTPIDFNDRKIYYSDAIMLMVNSKSDCFGWHESQGDVQHNDQYVIISAAEIDDWANKNKNIINDDLGDPVTDKFNRNFVGFDYEAQIDFSDVFDYPYVQLPDGSWGPSSEPSRNEDGIPYVRTGYYDNQGSVQVVPAGTPGAYPVKDRYVDGNQANGNVWVKIGCADGYYSDWIVCIVEGIKRTTDDTVYDLRIIAEDLSATQASDFDFNDVVIDIKYATATSATKIVLVAAGGQLPLRVGSNNGVGGVEVHEALLGADNAKNGNVYKMINTGYPAPKGATADPKDITNDINMVITNVTEANNLRIEVYKDGEWQLLTANLGEPACKLAVGAKFEILGERESIKDKYTDFVEWATTNNLSQWWNITE